MPLRTVPCGTDEGTDEETDEDELTVPDLAIVLIVFHILGHTLTLNR